MAYYFSVPHLGAGSPEVESLGCFFLRMARAHGCTQWQLARHLAAWWDHKQGNRTKTRFLSAQTLAISGAGQDVAKLVDALTQGTGIETLRSGTLLVLQQAAARTCLGTLRNTRAWCPACYENDTAARREIYDRLLWAIVPIGRCSIHAITLMDRCPTCGSTQDYTTRCTSLDRCGACGGSLVDGKRVTADRPELGEKLVEELVAASATDPGLTLNREGMRLFFKRSRCELPKGDPLLTTPSLTSRSCRPTLGTMIRMATAFNVSLLDFQSAQPPPVNRSLYTPQSPGFPARPRHKLPPEARVRVEEALETLLARPEMPPPFLAFCEQQRVSTGYVAYQFPVLAKRYAERRSVGVREKAVARLKAAQMAIDAGLMEDYTSGRMTQKKQLIRAVALTSKVSIVTARKAVASYPMLVKAQEGEDCGPAATRALDQ